MVVNYNLQKKIVLVSIGGLISLFLILSPGGLFILTLSIIIILIIKYHFKNEDNKFLLWLFIIGLISRIILTTGVHFFLQYNNLGIHNWFGYEIVDLFGDSGYHSIRGLWLAEFVSGKLFTPDFIKKEIFHYYGRSSYLYLVGLFHYLFGFSPISVKFINSFLGALSAIFIYSMTLEIFNKRVAKLSAILIMFFPSMFLWSITNLKDTSFIFISIIMIWAYVRWYKTKQFKYLVLCIISLFIQSTLREKFATTLPLFILAFSYFMTLKTSLIKKMGISIAVVTIIFLVLRLVGINLNQEIHRGVAKLVIYHIGHITTEGTSYKLLEEKYYPPIRANPIEMSYLSFGKVFVRAWLHLMFEPFPWRVWTKLQLIAYPQIILWYFLIPFIILGIFISLRYKWREVFVILTYLFIMTSIIALTSGNIGTAFRHRDMVSPFYLIFCGVGVVNFLNLWKKRP
jgi:4-amino-4-deoxy-L-arabinose transferase-like glycosyltransferase